MSRQKTPAELKAENDLLKRVHFGSGFVSVINTLIKYGALVIVVRYAYLTAAALAGKETVSNIVFNLITNLNMNQYMSYVIGGGGAAYGFSQRKLRKNTVQRLQSRNEKLELKVDPSRTSSMLTKSGETRPEDKR